MTTRTRRAVRWRLFSIAALPLLVLAATLPGCSGGEELVAIPDSAPFDPRGFWEGTVDGQVMTLNVTDIYEESDVAEPRAISGEWTWNGMGMVFLCSWKWTTDGSVSCGLFTPDFGVAYCFAEDNGQSQLGFDGFFEGETRLAGRIRGLTVHEFKEGLTCQEGPVLIAFQESDVTYVRR